jgi:hypothetical protein
MHSLAQQKKTRMLSASMTEGGVRIMAYPSQDRSTVDDEITSPNEPSSHGLQHREHEERLVQRGSCCMTTFALLGWTGNAQVSIFVQRQAAIPGYNRFPMNDFPRVAVSDTAGTVSMVWNDARQHGTGDIFLQSFNPGNLSLVQSMPVRINSRNNTGGWLFLPAVHQSDSNGNLSVTFYSRSSANTALTDVSAATKVNPRTTIPPTRNNTTVTTGPSDWNAVSSIIIPNFGDYADNYLVGTTLYVAWSDGRLGFPNPFEDQVSVH